MEAAALLAATRRRAGLSQAALAARAGTSQPVVSAYENGRREPTVPTLRRMLRAAGAQLELRAQALGTDAAKAERLDDGQQAARLVDVLVLADAIPVRRTGRLRFPRLSSR